MRTTRAALAGGVLVFLAACRGGEGGDADAPAGATPGTALIGAAGDTVTGPTAPASDGTQASLRADAFR